MCKNYFLGEVGNKDPTHWTGRGVGNIKVNSYLSLVRFVDGISGREDFGEEGNRINFGYIEENEHSDHNDPIEVLDKPVAFQLASKTIGCGKCVIRLRRFNKKFWVCGGGMCSGTVVRKGRRGPAR